jgi:UDP-N-acetylmuramoyl-tripeptide--D-alanyl-D-alanine ligase
MTLWTLGTLAAACGGRLSGADPATPVTGVSIDTRTLAPGDAFFAIQGVAKDAHEFAPAALAKGAACVVVSRPVGEPAITVPDVLESLRQAGIAARARIGDIPVVAVTGSVGKTGTKEMLLLAFGAAGSVHASVASYNNHWGVPLTLARMPADVDAAIFEIGMNHAGEITPLARMVRPDIAIITAVEAVHLEFFESVAGIADAKAEIFLGLPTGGTAIIPADNPYADRLRRAAEAAHARIVTFGEGKADVRLLSAEGGDVLAEVSGTTVKYRLAEAGRHVAMNSLTVLAALEAAGRDLALGAAALGGFTAPKGRGRRVRLAVAGGEAILLDEAFNANPAAMAAALAALGRTEGRRIAILGDMRELGPTAPELHRGLAGAVIEAGTRIVHTVGAMSEHLRDALPPEIRGQHFATAADLLAALPPVEPGDAVLVKASKAIGLAAVVDALEARYGGRDA